MTLRELHKRLGDIIAEADKSNHPHVRQAVDAPVLIRAVRNTKHRTPDVIAPILSVGGSPLTFKDGRVAFTLDGWEKNK